jgi:hypothetical protein
MTAGLRRRLVRLEAAIKAPDEPTHCRVVYMTSPTDPKPVAGQGERLLIVQYVAPRHEHDPDRSDCNCLTCWEKVDRAV